MEPTYKLELTQDERKHRADIIEDTRRMLLTHFPVEDEDSTSFVLPYEGFHLQVAFSALHPLVMLHFVCVCSRQLLKRDFERINRLNAKAVLGGHFLDDTLNCYVFRLTQWLDAKPEPERFCELLLRGYQEATRGFAELFSA